MFGFIGFSVLILYLIYASGLLLKIVRPFLIVSCIFHIFCQLLIYTFTLTPIEKVKFFEKNESNKNRKRRYFGEVYPDKGKVSFLKAIVVSFAPSYISFWFFIYLLNILVNVQLDALTFILVFFFIIVSIFSAIPSYTDLKKIPKAFKNDIHKSLYQILLVLISILLTVYIVGIVNLQIFHEIFVYIMITVYYFLIKFGFSLTWYFLSSINAEKHESSYPNKIGIKDFKYYNNKTSNRSRKNPIKMKISLFKNESRKLKKNQLMTGYENKILMGGITGDTKIHLADNRSITILELVDEYNLGKENYVFSLDSSFDIVIAKIDRPIEKKYASTLMKITFDNYQTIYCDLNCKFITRDGQAINSIDLYTGKSLMPLKINYAKEIPITKRTYKDKRLKLEDYLVVYNPATDLYNYIHRLADDYNLKNNFYTKERGNIRHHDDLNKYNNNPPNIMRKFFKEHFKIHSKFASKRAKRNEIGWGRAHELHPDFYSKMASENMRKLHQDPEFQERHSKRASKNMSDYLKSEEFYEMTRVAGDRGKKYLIKYNKSEKGRKKSSEIGKHGRMKCQKCGQEVFGRAKMTQHYKKKHPQLWAQQQNSFQKGSLKYIRSEEARKIQSEKLKSGKMTCNKCGEIIYGASELKKHYAERHNDPVVCPFCGKLYKGKGGLSTHVIFCLKNPDRKIREIGRFPCPYCDKIFDSQRGLSGHITRGHKITNHKVIDIEIIDCKPIVIYNLSIKNYDNFGLSAGIFVHT